MNMIKKDPRRLGHNPVNAINKTTYCGKGDDRSRAFNGRKWGRARSDHRIRDPALANRKYNRVHVINYCKKEYYLPHQIHSYAELETCPLWIAGAVIDQLITEELKCG